MKKTLKIFFLILSANQTSFDDIVGLEAAKNALNETVILPALRPDVFTGWIF